MLSRVAGKWTITDCLRFKTWGKYAGVSATLTSDPGNSGAALGDPFVTVTEMQGGRGGTIEINATYTLNESKLQRVNLE